METWTDVGGTLRSLECVEVCGKWSTYRMLWHVEDGNK